MTGSLRRQGLVSAAGERTSAGGHADEQLDHWLEIGRQQSAGWSHQQSWRRAYLAGAGASILLMTNSASVLDPSDGYAVAVDQLMRDVRVLDAGFVRVAADSHGDEGGG